VGKRGGDLSPPLVYSYLVSCIQFCACSLRQIKVRIADLTERKTIWTTANRTIVEGVATKAKGNGVVGVKKLPSGDILVQLKEQASKEKPVRSQGWLPLLSLCLMTA
jgi:hypothetical protein